MHIVSFNVPLPADYGGVIDVFYRIKALAEAGVDIHLHCFTYGRTKNEELERYCSEVCYYDRDMSPLLMFRHTPFIVISRRNEQLMEKLAKDDFPILLEGLHCCSVLDDRRFHNRKVMVRAHNIESDYYRMLAKAESKLIKKAYLKIESAKIRRYEPILSRASAVFAISQSDKACLERMGCSNVQVVGGANPYKEVKITPGLGEYALYHGNLSVPENYKAAEYLIDNIFSTGEHRLVVAGYRPPARLIAKADRLSNVKVVESPDDSKMSDLIANAQVNVLVSNQPTGFKMKLLNALYNGRHCLVNSTMVCGSGLESLCAVVEGDEEFRVRLNELMRRELRPDDVEKRREVLSAYSRSTSVNKIIDQL